MEKECLTLNDILEWDKVKEYIYPKIANRDKVKEYLNIFPHTNIADLPVIYMIKIPTDDEEIATIIIKNEYLGAWGKSIEDLHKKAVDNISDAPVEYRLLNDFIKMLTKQTEMKALDKSIYVLTNKEKTFGAAEILNVGMMSKIAENFDSDCIIIPSSLHEVLILEDKGMTKSDYDSIRDMVKEVNAKYVDSKDVLSDNIYRYDRNKREISIIE